MDDVIEGEINQITRNFQKKFHNLNILITGGAGFLGSWLCDVLTQLDANILCLDNLTSGLRENIKHLEKAYNFT